MNYKLIVNIKNGLIFKTRLGYFVINYADDNRVVYSPIVERQKEMDRATKLNSERKRCLRLFFINCWQYVIYGL